MFLKKEVSIRTSLIYSIVVKFLKRYLPAFVAANVGALLGGLLAHYLVDNIVVTVLAATWGENVGYYGHLLLADLRERKKIDKSITLKGFYKVVRNMAIEFGPAEVLDSFLVRPLFIFIALRYIENTALGILLGRSLADVLFHVVAGTMYTLRKKYVRD